MGGRKGTSKKDAVINEENECSHVYGCVCTRYERTVHLNRLCMKLTLWILNNLFARIVYLQSGVLISWTDGQDVPSMHIVYADVRTRSNFGRKRNRDGSQNTVADPESNNFHFWWNSKFPQFSTSNKFREFGMGGSKFKMNSTKLNYGDFFI